jgi:Caspase domain
MNSHAAPFPNGFAVIVGVPGEGLTRCPNDAQDIYNVLIDPDRCGYDTSHVALLDGGSGESAPNASNLRRAFAKLKDEATSFSTNYPEKPLCFLFFYSGHGGYTPNYHLQLSGFKEARHRIPSAALMKDHALYALELQELLDNFPAARKVALLDCCYAGGMWEPTIMVEDQDQAKRLEPAQADGLGRGRGAFLLAGAHAGQVAYEGFSGEHSRRNSVFTLALKEGLEGYGQTRGGTEVWFGDLVSHVSWRVRQMTNEQKMGQQRPFLNFRDASNFIIAHTRRRPGTKSSEFVTPVDLEPISDEHTNAVLDPSEESYTESQTPYAREGDRQKQSIDLLPILYGAAIAEHLSKYPKPRRFEVGYNREGTYFATFPRCTRDGKYLPHPLSSLDTGTTEFLYTPDVAHVYEPVTLQWDDPNGMLTVFGTRSGRRREIDVLGLMGVRN